MSDLIIHHNGAYNIYGTIADGCHYMRALTLDQLRMVVKESYGEHGLRTLPERLERAHRTGCSHINNWTLDDCISANRAGPNESSLSREEFIRQFLTLPTPAALDAGNTGTDGGEEPPANARQVTRRMTAATLVNELVEQGKFFERGDISEAEFIATVNHYVAQFAGGMPGRDGGQRGCRWCGGGAPWLSASDIAGR